MESLVLKPLLVILLVGVHRVPAFPAGQEAATAGGETADGGAADWPDLDTADTHNRFAVFPPPPHQTTDQHTWGPPPWSRPGAAERRPNLPWYSSPRSFPSTFDEETVTSDFGSRLPASSSSLSFPPSTSSSSSSSSRHTALAAATDRQDDTSPRPPSSRDSLIPTGRQVPSSDPKPAPSPSLPVPRSSSSRRARPSRARGSSRTKSDPHPGHLARPTSPESNLARPSYPRHVESNSFRARGKASPRSPDPDPAAATVPAASNRRHTYTRPPRDERKLDGSSKYSRNRDDQGHSEVSGRQGKAPSKKAPWGRRATQSTHADASELPPPHSPDGEKDRVAGDPPASSGAAADPMDTEATQSAKRYRFLHPGRDTGRTREEASRRKDTDSVFDQPQDKSSRDPPDATTDGEPDRTPSSKHQRPPPPPRPNHSLRLHRHQSTYPFESEVRGDGYHSRIRFDPFGSGVPLKDQESPRGQTFGNWALPPAPSGGRDANPAPHAESHDFQSGERGGRPGSLPASTFSRPKPRPPLQAPQSTVFLQSPGRGQPSKSVTPAPVTARPFSNPGNLVGPRDDGAPSVAGKPVSHAQPSDSRTSHERVPPSFDYDYPSVANVFDNGPVFDEHSDVPESTAIRREYWPADGPHRPKDDRLHSPLLPTSDDRQHSLSAPPLTPVRNLDSSPPTDPQGVGLVEEASPQGAEADPVVSDYPVDYYDDLYDEFLDLYYNLEGDYGEVSDAATAGEGGDSQLPSESSGGDGQPRTTTPGTTSSTTRFAATVPPTKTTTTSTASPPPSTTTTTTTTTPAPPKTTTTTTTTPPPPPSTTTTTTTPSPPPTTTTTTTTPAPPKTTTTTTTTPALPLPTTTTTTTTPPPPPSTTTTTTTSPPPSTTTTTSTSPPPSTTSTTTTPAPPPSTTTTTTTPAPPPSTTTTTTTPAATPSTTTSTSSTTVTSTSTSTTTQVPSTNATTTATTLRSGRRPWSSTGGGRRPWSSTGGERRPWSTSSGAGRPSDSRRGGGRRGGGKYSQRSRYHPQGSGSAVRGQEPEQDAEDDVEVKATTSPSASNTGKTAGAASGAPISLSEIMQAMEMSLPQFLVALKGHGLSLKEFTTSLQAKGLTQREFRKTQGDLGSLLNVITEGLDSPPSDQDEDGSTIEEEEGTDGKRVTPETTRKPTTTTTTTTTTTSTTTATTSTTTTTSEPTTASPSTPSPSPKIFGFRPAGRPQFSGGKAANETKEETDEESQKEKAPVPIKLDIADVMKEKGLSASDILHDLGSLFTMAEPDAANEAKPAAEGKSTGENITTSGDTKEPESTADGKNTTQILETTDGVSSTVKPYTVPDTPVSLRPYRPSGGSERYRPRPYNPPGQGGTWGGGFGSHRSIITNRLHTTQRPTLRPPYQPRTTTATDDLSSVLNTLHNSTTSSSGNEIFFGLPHDHEEANPDLEDDPRYSKGDYFPIYDSDPDSLNMSTKSAILAASILGGVAMCVFLAILVVVMYRGRARLRRTPLNIPSDASSSSTPPIYSSRISGGKGLYKTSGFWGTLKKRFDPYSLSPTPTVMT